MKFKMRNKILLITTLFLMFFHLSCKSQSYTTINVIDAGVFPQYNKNETSQEKSLRFEKIDKLFRYAIKHKVNLFFPAGIYDIGNHNFPFRTPNSAYAVKRSSLLDCGNITIKGEKGTVFKSSSLYGADVLQLNQIKNIRFKNLEITATVKDLSRSGSNGISITNGFDNIILEDIYIYDLPGVDKGTWIDGGKGLTIQSEIGSKSLHGKLIAKNIWIKNVAYGFRMDTGYVSDFLDKYKTINLDLDLNVEKAWQGISIEFGKATKNIIKDSKLGIKIKAELKNCQQYVRFARVIGGNYTFYLVRTQSYDQVMRDNNNKLWVKESDGVFGFLSYYTKSANVVMTGDVGEVDNKIWIGAVGSITEAFNLRNRTEHNTLNFDITGSSKKEDIKIISWQGESLHDNQINVSKRTTKKIPADFLKNNNIFKTVDYITF